jgi:abhydrolase domain-containing protein 6
VPKSFLDGIGEKMKTVIRYWLFTILLLCGLGGYSYADSAKSTQDCDIATHEVAVGNGVLYYSKAGNGPNILLLHGLFAQKEQWNGILCLLSAAGYTAIAPDLPGYGKSVDFPLMDYKLENQVALLQQFMDTLGIDAFDLAGSSMGGAIAALYVQQHPQQIRTLAFIGSPLGIIDWSPQVKEAIYQGINPFIPIQIEQFNLEMSLLFVNPPPIPESAKEAAVKDYIDHNRHYQQVWNIVNLYDTVFYNGLKIRVPTLILWGQEDRIFSIEGADQLRNRIFRSKRVKLPNASHLLLLENTDETAAIYIGFLKSKSAEHSWQR